MPKEKPVLTPAQVIRRRRTDYLIARDYKSLLLRCLGLALVLWVMVTQVFLITQVTGNEMFPALEDGDLTLAYRLHKGYAKNDVMVFQMEGQRRVGRILGRPGDLIHMDESGTLRVNGTPQSGDILYPTYSRDGTVYPYEIPDGCVYILCDYRTQCQDSRDFGPVPMEALEGKVITILRRRGI